MLEWVDAMARELDQSRARNGHIGIVHRYLLGDQDLPLAPPDATEEYRALAQTAITNFLPLIGGTFTKQLRVEGYRTGRSAEDVAGWDVWQRNRMDARQSITMGGAVNYGVSYVGVDREEQKILTFRARKSHAWFDGDDDPHPIAGLTETGVRTTPDGEIVTRYEFWHAGTVRTYERVTGRKAGFAADPAHPYDGRDVQIGRLTKVGEDRTLTGDVPVPWVRFRDDLDEEMKGALRPLIPAQNRVNASVFYLLMLLHYAAFQQKWATGLVIPRDTQETLPDGTPNPNFGRPIEAYKTAVDRLWVSESSDTTFGAFPQSAVDGHLSAIQDAIGTLISLGQGSPLLAAGNSISNVAIESISVLNSAMNSQIDAYRDSFGESWELVYALLGIGTPDAAVRWRDTEPRNFAQIVDGLVKLHQIGAPAEGLFEWVPRITDQQLEQWKALAAKPTDTDRLADAIARQTAPALPDAPADA